MDPTALPTDNLYKFLALSGVLAMGFSMWMLWKILQSGTERLVRLKTSRARLRQKGIERQLKLISDEIDAIDARLNAPDAASSAEFEKRDARLQELQKCLLEGFSAVDQQSLALAGEESRSSTEKAGAIAVTIVFAVGACLSILGFYAWSKHTQRYQDEVTILQRDKARLEVETARLELEAAKAKTRKGTAPPNP